MPWEFFSAIMISHYSHKMFLYNFLMSAINEFMKINILMAFTGIFFEDHFLGIY